MTKYKLKSKKKEREFSLTDWDNINYKVPKTIRTAKGTAYYIRTDIEDENEKWRGNNLTTSEGFYIIHEGKKHHIYQV